MQLNQDEQLLLLKEFPRIELSYETNVHKKVYYSDFILAIPAGRKCFIWFSTYQCQNVCIMLEIGDHKKITKIKIIPVCFHSELSYGTIFYGTLFHNRNTQYMSIEDIFFYKGNNVSSHLYSKKLLLLQTIFSTEIKQVSYFQDQVIFGLPVICATYTDIYKKIQLLPYKIKYIQFVYNTNKKYNVEHSEKEMLQEERKVQSTTNSTNISRNIPREISKNNPKEINKNTSRETSKTSKHIIFKVKPDIQNDIYHLYCNDEHGIDNYYDVAYIPDYKTSVMMNSLFRNIKENVNLDALEESDDDEEFEDDRLDKFVFLEREFLMMCVKNYKFNKWTPIRIAFNEETIVSKKDLSIHHNKMIKY